MNHRLTSGILIFFVMSALFMVLGEKMANALQSAFITSLAGASFILCYLIWTAPFNPPENVFRKPIFQFFTILFLATIGIGFGYFSYWLFCYEPFDVMCRYSHNCEIGPYGWSVALLSLGCSLLCFICNYLFMALRFGE